jgi:hypothetical protein
MANDPDRYAALEKDWNMGPFYVLVNSNNGDVGDKGNSSVTLYRKVGPHFFANAKANDQIVRLVTITLTGPPVDIAGEPK